MFKEKLPNNNQFNQALADLGYPRDTWGQIPLEKQKELVQKQISYQTYKENIEQKEIPETTSIMTEEIRERYKQAYENLELSVAVIEESGTPERKALLKEVLRLAGQEKNKDIINNFITKHEDTLSDEEIELLKIKTETLV